MPASATKWGQNQSSNPQPVPVRTKSSPLGPIPPSASPSFPKANPESHAYPLVSAPRAASLTPILYHRYNAKPGHLGDRQNMPRSIPHEFPQAMARISTKYKNYLEAHLKVLWESVCDDLAIPTGDIKSTGQAQSRGLLYAPNVRWLSPDRLDRVWQEASSMLQSHEPGRAEMIPDGAPAAPWLGAVEGQPKCFSCFESQ